MVVLDTNFLIDLDNNRPEAIEKAREIERESKPRRVPRIVVTELWIAVGKGTKADHNREKFERLLAGLPHVDLTAPIAKKAGEIEGRTQPSDPNGIGVGMADAIITATALEFDEPVVTDDETDFCNRIGNQAGITELEVDLYASG
ncbi:PilT domain-containing protein [Halalkaliarchaeum desulfuricum]|uniref:PilT domain-containing protein n=1 Tax=Halalkaliarchaeum desulfuricum TaxID=2055893 RepID=A0A343TIX1_9EURY|nr:PIN domain-containing protein [Halalkaliarchaeum desulfuricum]AUX09043.1 PilT domain-containing protein [Halalkaliarchaeum desulfuricum]